MRSLYLILLFLASQCSVAAWALPAKAQAALDAALRARSAQSSASLQSAAESVYKEGASAAELIAFLAQAPAKAPPAELEKGLTDMAGLLKEGLEDREARKAALKALQARMNAEGHGSDAKANSAKPGPGDDSLRRAQAERREETRRRLGKRGAEADLEPTPGAH